MPGVFCILSSTIMFAKSPPSWRSDFRAPGLISTHIRLRPLPLDHLKRLDERALADYTFASAPSDGPVAGVSFSKVQRKHGLPPQPVENVCAEYPEDCTVPVFNGRAHREAAVHSWANRCNSLLRHSGHAHALIKALAFKKK